MSSRVDDLESSFKNLAHNVQGFSEPIRHPTTPSGKRKPHSRAMVIGDENCDKAIEVRWLMANSISACSRIPTGLYAATALRPSHQRPSCAGLEGVMLLPCLPTP